MGLAVKRRRDSNATSQITRLVGAVARGGGTTLEKMGHTLGRSTVVNSKSIIANVTSDTVN